MENITKNYALDGAALNLVRWPEFMLQKTEKSSKISNNGNIENV